VNTEICAVSSNAFGGTIARMEVGSFSQNCDVNLVTVELVKKNENMCLFLAVYNSLPLKALRRAFIAGKAKTGLNKFFELASVSIKINRDIYGYDAKDMGKYLSWLQREGRIERFQWKTYDAQRAMRQVFVCPHSFQKLPITLVLFGWGMNSERRKIFKGRWGRKEQKARHGGVVWNEADRINYFFEGQPSSFLKTAKVPLYTHGIAVRIEEDLSIWLVDNGCPRIRRVYSMYDVGIRIVAIDRCYVFDITV